MICFLIMACYAVFVILATLNPSQGDNYTLSEEIFDFDHSINFTYTDYFNAMGGYIFIGYATNTLST